ncbi:hypothetical protein N9D02_02705 [Emcibacteraceae bacterium]|uniref:hypothetical protein n=1 Tax=Pseudemcibacter sp. TaxID=2943293 RepID=UPI00231805CA|nr:hypothetical protein [Emcibacteraceae bacterium]
MNIKRFWLSIIPAYIAMSVVGALGTMLLIEPLESFMALGRPEAELAQMMPYTIMAYLVMTVLYAYVYVEMRKDGSIKEGAKIGAVIGMIISCLTWVYYSMLPFEIPAVLVDNVINITSSMAGGIMFAIIYKPIEK